MREIGSEFWQQYPKVSVKPAYDEAYLLSGRTALWFIIKDICARGIAKKVLIPSYCCESMIEPFIREGICVEFYQVRSDGIDYPFENDVDIVFLIDFFGWSSPQNAEIARLEKMAGKIIIYDATHKIDGNPQVQAYADYIFCSYRKWFYCNYAKVVKRSGGFEYYAELLANRQYIALRDKAAKQKEQYFAGMIGHKQGFLLDFATAEEILDKDYLGYSGEPVAFELDEIVAKRKENAAYLIRGLKGIPEIKLWRDNVENGDTPMFVPILVEPSIRSNLRDTLNKECIYCPIHWPKSCYLGVNNELYDMELSLICDQRYDLIDMERMLRVIKDYFS